MVNGIACFHSEDYTAFSMEGKTMGTLGQIGWMRDNTSLATLAAMRLRRATLEVAVAVF